MAKMTGDWFMQRLKAWGVTRIYGYSGDGINGVLGALQRTDEDGQPIDFVQVRHEEMAAFMATAHAKFTGELGVCLSTGGPGATHMLTGLYDAKLDHMPVLAIMGQAEVTARGANYQQELNLDRIFADVCADSGTSGPWYAAYHRMKSGQRGTVSGGLASMGAAVPYAIAAKFAHPSRPVVALVGDGAMQMNNMAELITVQRYWRRWADPRLIVCVLNNEDLSEVSWEQRATEGNPRYPATQDLPNVPYAKFASMLGLKGIYVDHPDDLEAAWLNALAADHPVVLEVKTDANVPPLPPHISSEQVKAFLAAFMKGGRPLAGVMAKSLKRAIHERV